MNQQVIFSHEWPIRTLLSGGNKMVSRDEARPDAQSAKTGEESALVDLDALRRILAEMKSLPED